MKTQWILLVAIVLGSCTSPGEEAQKEYEIVAQNGTTAEKCEALQKVVNAWLREKNQAKYEHEKMFRDAECQAAANE